MRVLVVGSGGREHALAWALSRSASVAEVISAPGNPGMAAVGECKEVDIDDVAAVVELARRVGPALVVVGPEAPLVAGLADALLSEGIPTFGPGASWARLEGSKSFAKSLMGANGIPTAGFRSFTNSEEAIAFVRSSSGRVVVKADGLAAGKGVIVASGPDEAAGAVRDLMESGSLGASGSTIVVEDFLEGPELSVLAFTDGKTIVPLEAAQDFKRALDGDSGPNTGGMGSYSPVPIATHDVLERVGSEVFEPLTRVFARREGRYVGVVYAGLVLTSSGPEVLEFNCRFGDPETQALIPRVEFDLAEIMVACVEGSLDGVKLRWRDDACVSVVGASAGYPSNYAGGFHITGIEEAEKTPGVVVFHAGTALSNGDLVTDGGRVLAVSCTGESLASARAGAYEAINKIHFEGIQYRRDIAQLAATT